MTIGMLISKLRRLGVHYQGLDQIELPTRIEADLLRFDIDTPVAGFLLELRMRLREVAFMSGDRSRVGASTQIELTL